MIGLWNTHAQGYLLVLMAVTTVTFALPLFVAPLAWARLFHWRLPGETDLAVYFGRCLGAFVLIVDAVMLRAGATGEGLGFHVSGAARGGDANDRRPRVGRPPTNTTDHGDPGGLHVCGHFHLDNIVLSLMSCC